MIHVKRGSAPRILNTPRFRKEYKVAEKFFATPAAERRQKIFRFTPLTKIGSIVKALRSTFSGHCAYCEVEISVTNTRALDSFRPRQEAVGTDGSFHPDHYWWVTYRWFNMYLVCFNCNQLKGSRFPIAGELAKPGASFEQLRREVPLLLDPCEDYPEDHLLFDTSGRVASDTERGRCSIEVFALNRQELVEARHKAFTELQAGWELLLAHLKAGEKFDAKLLDDLLVYDQDAPYQGMRRQFLQLWSRELVEREPKYTSRLRRFLTFRTALPPETDSGSNRSKVEATFVDFNANLQSQDQYSVESEADKSNYYRRARLVDRVEIRNFRGIEELTLKCQSASDEQGTCLLLLGENGAGKSSVLQALALTLLGQEHLNKLIARQRLTPDYFIRDSVDESLIRVFLTGSSTPIELRLHRGAPPTITPPEPKVLLLGYGSTRLLPRGQDAQLPPTPSSRTDNLFNPFVPLNDSMSWLLDLPEEDFDVMARALKELCLLGDADRLVASKQGRCVTVVSKDTSVSLDKLSDGYQSVVALAADIMSVMRQRWPVMSAAEGVVLIDEIDAHLHPRWKMQIVTRLRRVFPRIQFVMTSHEPLSLRSLNAGEVIVMRRNAEGRVQAETELPSPAGLRVDQLLTSEFFGLGSTRSPEDDELFREYYALLAERQLTPKQTGRLTELKAVMKERDLMGSTPRERLMLEAADEYLAAAPTLQTADRKARKETARKKIVDLWQSIQPIKE